MRNLGTGNLFFIHYIIVIFVAISLLETSAQSTSSKNKPHIAVLPFEGKGIPENEAHTLSDRFRGNLVITEAYVVLERDQIDEIFKEQSFQLTGCTSIECAVEAGKILNVQNMVTGSIGKLGRTYTIDIFLIDVETSQIKQSFRRDYKGKIDGLLLVLEEIALEMMPPRKGITRFPLYLSGITAGLAAGLGVYSYINAENSYDKYKKTKTGENINDYMDDTKRFDDISKISGIVAGSSVLFYFVYYYFYKRSKRPPTFHAAASIDNHYAVILTVSLDL